MNERTSAMGIAVFFQYGMNALVYFSSPVMIHWSIIGTCIIFGVINVFNLAVVTRYVKETKGCPWKWCRNCSTEIVQLILLPHVVCPAAGGDDIPAAYLLCFSFSVRNAFSQFLNYFRFCVDCIKK